MGFSKWIERRANRNTILIALVIFFILSFILMGIISPLILEVSEGLNPPDTRLWYTPGEIELFLTTIGEEGRQLYRFMQIVDAFYPLSYAFTFALLISRLNGFLKPRTRSFEQAALFGPITAIFDYLENILIATQVEAYPNLAYSVLSIASVMTIIKWTMMMLTLAYFVLSIVTYFVLRRRIT